MPGDLLPLPPWQGDDKNPRPPTATARRVLLVVVAIVVGLVFLGGALGSSSSQQPPHPCADIPPDDETEALDDCLLGN